MDVKREVFLQLLNKRKLRNGTKTYLEQKFFLFIVKFKKLGFSAPLKCYFSVFYAIFQSFFPLTPFPGNFSADALGCKYTQLNYKQL